MKDCIRIAIAIFSAVILFDSCFGNHPKENPGFSINENNFEPIAVIELFTSQGCSSCPPADELFNKTIQTAGKRGLNVFALAFHVDYWDRLGWKDPFSEAVYSARQRMYASRLKAGGVYTPQMIINGTTGFVGSDAGRLETEMRRALSQKATVEFSQLQAVYKKDTGIFVNYMLTEQPRAAVIRFALLSQAETTMVKRGENTGRTLVNANVVRSFLSTPALQKGQVKLSTPVSGGQLMLIAFIQNENDLKITGAAGQHLSAGNGFNSTRFNPNLSKNNHIFSRFVTGANSCQLNWPWLSFCKTGKENTTFL